MLKTYIEINLANGFIWPSKSLVGASILFVRKPDGFPHPIWPFQILGDAVRIIQCTDELSGLHQEDPGQEAWHLRHRLSGWYLHLYQGSGPGPRGGRECQFYKDGVCFLGYVSAQVIRMEDERIEAVKNWPEPTSVRDIQVFIGFANFYWRFIQGFSRIAVLLTSLLKTTGSSDESASKAFRADDDEVVGGRANETVVNSSKNDKSRNSTRVPNIGATGEPNFLTPDAKKAFNHLRLAFIEAPILRHFDPDMSGLKLMHQAMP